MAAAESGGGGAAPKPARPPPRRGGGGRCPICGRPPAPPHRPFCSVRCAQIDLGRWLGGGYAIPAEEKPDPGRGAEEEEEEEAGRAG